MSQQSAEAAVIEIYERGHKTTPGTGTIIVPNKVCINGAELLTPADDPIEVHGISTFGHDVLKVTLTLFARRVVMGAEDDE